MGEYGNCLNVKTDLKSCFKIYKQYEYILDAYVLDFYTDEHWSKLPNSWKAHFANISLEELGYVLDTSVPLTKFKSICPLSILALRTLFKIFNISRSPNLINNLYSIPNQHTVFKQNQIYTQNNMTTDNKLLNHPKLTNSFWKHISPKKKHEIILMAQICANVAQYSNCDVLLDFGSGLGHLSRILSYGYGLKVFCLEAQKKLSLQAKILDKQFEVSASKYLTKLEIEKFQPPIHINVKIEPTTNLTTLIQDVKESLNLIEAQFQFGVIGLHPCGDLAAMLLRCFKNEPNIKFICVASCCYMKLTTDVEQSGYPLSTFLLSTENHLSYISRELSCHAIESYIDRLKTGNYIDLKIHAFRASLEKILVKYYPNKKHTGLRNVKCTKHLTFEQYCEKALNGLDLNIPKAELINEDMQKQIENWRKVVIFYSLRLMFAPMIETILLLDRFLFTAETDVKCVLLPIFDPKVSPRSHILIATKINKSS